MVFRHTPDPSQVPLVGRRLRRLRKERRLSHEELGARAGIAAGELVRLEKDEYRVSLDMLIRLLAALQVGPEELFGAPETALAAGGLQRTRDR
jgi:transcriptional regulator with XRE-family HTH domain